VQNRLSRGGGITGEKNLAADAAHADQKNHSMAGAGRENTTGHRDSCLGSGCVKTVRYFCPPTIASTDGMRSAAGFLKQ
jgi:hypothetical protein